MDMVIDLPRRSPEEGFLSVLRRCGRVLLEPARFFRHDLPAMSVTDTFAFGIGNAWISAVLAFFVQTINSLLLSQLFESWMQRMMENEEGFRVWGLAPDSFLWTSGLLLVLPFLLLIRIFLSGFFLYLCSRLLIEDHAGAPEQVNFNTALKIEAASLSSNWYSLVPLFGGMLSFVVGIVLRVTGIRERFGVSNSRAIAVVVLPYLVLAGMALVIGALLVLVLSQVPLQELLALDPGAFEA